jgi:hypothetical protein
MHMCRELGTLATRSGCIKNTYTHKKSSLSPPCTKLLVPEIAPVINDHVVSVYGLVLSWPAWREKFQGLSARPKTCARTYARTHAREQARMNTSTHCSTHERYTACPLHASACAPQYDIFTLLSVVNMTVLLSTPHAYTHTHTRTHSRTRTHTNTHTHQKKKHNTNTQTHALLIPHTHIYTHTHSQTRILLQCTQTQKHMSYNKQIGIASVWWEGNPCNMHLLDLSVDVKKGVEVIYIYK